MKYRTSLVLARGTVLFDIEAPTKEDALDCASELAQRLGVVAPRVTHTSREVVRTTQGEEWLRLLPWSETPTAAATSVRVGHFELVVTPSVTPPGLWDFIILHNSAVCLHRKEYITKAVAQAQAELYFGRVLITRLLDTELGRSENAP